MSSIFSKLQNQLNLLGGGQTPLPQGFIGPQQPPVQGPPTISEQVGQNYQKIAQQPGFNNALFRLGTTLLAAREQGMGLGEGLVAGQSAYNSEIDRAKAEQAAQAQAQIEALKYQTDTAFKMNAADLEQRKFGLEAGKTAQELNMKRKELAMKLKEFDLKAQSGGLTPQDIFERGTKLRGEYITSSKDFVTQRDAFGRIQASAEDPTPAGDLALIYNFMKVQDPGSTVRESEFAAAAQSGAFGDRIQGAVSKVINGERLAPAQRADFLDRAGKLYTSASSQHSKLTDEYTKLAQKAGADPSQVAIDMGIAEPSSQPMINAPVQSTGFKFIGFK